MFNRRSRGNAPQATGDHRNACASQTYGACPKPMATTATQGPMAPNTGRAALDALTRKAQTLGYAGQKKTSDSASQNDLYRKRTNSCKLTGI